MSASRRPPLQKFEGEFGPSAIPKSGNGGEELRSCKFFPYFHVAKVVKFLGGLNA